MKKLLSVLLCMVMIIGLLTACGGGQPATPNNTAGTSNNANSGSNSEESLSGQTVSMVDFASGQLGFTRNVASLKGTLKDVDFDWDILPNPVGPDKDAPVAVGVAAYAVPKGAPHKAAAIEVIKYITSAEIMADDFVMSSWAPTRISVLSSDKYLNQVKPTADHIQLALVDPMKGNTRLYPTCDHYDEADLKVKEILSAWYAGQYSSTAEMAADMEAQLNDILSK